MKKLVWLCVLAILVAGGAHGLQYLRRHRAETLGRVREMERFAWLSAWGQSEQSFLEEEHARCFAPAFQVGLFSTRFERGAYERCLDQAAEQRLGRLARLERPYWSRRDQDWLRLDYTLRLAGLKLPERGLIQRQAFECAGEKVADGQSPVSSDSFDEVAPGELIAHALVGAQAVGQRTGACFLVLSLEIEGSARNAGPLDWAPGVALARLRLPFPPPAQEIQEPTPIATPTPEPTPTPRPKRRR